ncbi:hypothetical protein DEU56DRAFT_911847 [Suillus clintonianus]|uniref:uncharacterized protein n=1 Tax=Suillus clintonianus TaxID=1904413 RepID=UPI001B86021D|nr:uncharacterized protein DEU56DRAFT_913069 [Suillus clintonianus]XP_041209414.1 uncharacterized protein DEU56DRAFT_911847 [Suillus clintonianus]KAG2135978.1 hypothetical protein DEU56DRAFT_913069 [Suillus clintonianus]KAG2140144.1 hypothetical protein DEU56DRAFT_911847 [Suillus clintonianus]
MSNVTVADNAWTSVVNVFGDVVFVDIQNTISLDNTYCFNLNLDSPGPKKIVFRIRQQTNNHDSGSDDSVTEYESDEEENGGNGDDAEMKTEDAEVGINEVKVEDEDLDAVISPDFEPVVASPCSLLTRRIGNPNPDPENPTAPWSYYIKKRTEVQEDQEEMSVEDPAASL